MRAALLQAVLHRRASTTASSSSSSSSRSALRAMLFSGNPTTTAGSTASRRLSNKTKNLGSVIRTMSSMAMNGTTSSTTPSLQMHLAGCFGLDECEGEGELDDDGT
eukprot:CAMPEP_0117025744 /NCGR_PEP_ID=MMETSP0472-20121206/18991_1 /TAXON_ID=693140 ORGANISM="Tiarina fusus, Strain LIS" /NCGR_SAMPLE_ID=MMETSP0472 /ASSEMBLY_ACC=CAM_ASM_000603 /LENGTH=105 /DNA_ID=CAMNT_0004732553 /DNA_START=182 /DNA_END=499 /DNA_ORIENTATION=+